MRKTVPGLRLTRRGRVVVAGTGALLVTALMAAAASAAQAAAADPGHRHRPVSDVAQVTVLPGDSLWSVAVRTAPNADARIVIQEIIQLNNLSGTVIYPGEQLRVPHT